MAIVSAAEEIDREKYPYESVIVYKEGSLIRTSPFRYASEHPDYRALRVWGGKNSKDKFDFDDTLDSMLGENDIDSLTNKLAMDKSYCISIAENAEELKKKFGIN